MAKWDIDRAKDKKQEIGKVLSEKLAQVGLNDTLVAIVSKKIIASGLNISPPEEAIENNAYEMRKITIEAFNSSSESIKPGNIRMNIIDFLESIGTGIMTFAGGLLYPWLYLLGFLLLWKQLRDCATIEIKEKESKVIWSMWELKKEELPLMLINIVSQLNTISKRYNVPALNKGEIDLALSHLEKINCIKRITKDEWQIIEEINVEYE